MSQESDFDNWNEVKKNIENKTNIIQFKERDIFWASLGKNIGFEQNGKGNDFSRPILVVKKLNNHLFFGVPLSTKQKNGNFFFSFTLQDKTSNALLVKAKIIDVKRIDKKIGTMGKDDFQLLKSKLGNLLGFCSPTEVGSPEGN